MFSGTGGISRLSGGKTAALPTADSLATEATRDASPRGIPCGIVSGGTSCGIASGGTSCGIVSDAPTRRIVSGGEAAETPIPGGLTRVIVSGEGIVGAGTEAETAGMKASISNGEEYVVPELGSPYSVAPSIGEVSLAWGVIIHEKKMTADAIQIQAKKWFLFKMFSLIRRILRSWRVYRWFTEVFSDFFLLFSFLP